MRLASRPRELALASFVALSLGFAAGWWLARQDSGSGQVMTGAGGEVAPHPVGASEYLQLGGSAMESGDLGTAERYFRRAVELEPGSAIAHANLGAVFLLLGRWDEASEELKTAREADPESPDAWFLTGMLRRDGYGDPAGARQAWGRFLELTPPESPQANTVREWIAALENPSAQ